MSLHDYTIIVMVVREYGLANNANTVIKGQNRIHVVDEKKVKEKLEENWFCIYINKC